MATTARPDHRQVSIARAMVRAARAVELSQLSAPAQAKLKMCLLDFLSCAFEARDLPTSRQAIAVAAKLTSGSAIVGSDSRHVGGRRELSPTPRSGTALSARTCMPAASPTMAW